MTDELTRTINLGCRIREFHDILKIASEETSEELRKFKEIDENDPDYACAKCQDRLLDQLCEEYHRIFDCYIRIFDEDGYQI